MRRQGRTEICRAKKKGQPVRGLCFRAADAGRRRDDPATRRLAAAGGGNRARTRRAIDRRRGDDLSWPRRRAARPALLACHQENVAPDYAALAKGLTGGYLPLAATLTTREVFNAFLGEYDEFKTFFHGHSFTGNQLGAAAALASLEILESPACLAARRALEKVLRDELKTLWPLGRVGDIRQVGLVAGVELVKNWKTREPYPLREQAGLRVSAAMARRGVLTRPVGNVIVIMPPYCTSAAQAQTIVRVLRESIIETLGVKAP